MEISRISRQLYDALKELYKQIDNNAIQDGEVIIKYSGEMHEKIRKALHDYVNCLSIYK